MMDQYFEPKATFSSIQSEECKDNIKFRLAFALLKFLENEDISKLKIVKKFFRFELEIFTFAIKDSWFKLKTKATYLNESL